MIAIVAVDKNWGIGHNGGMLFRLPADLKRFRAITLNGAVIMGRRTLESFPGGKPLGERVNIVLSRTLLRDDVVVVRNDDELFREVARYADDKVFLIGGGEVYNRYIDYCSEAFVTFADAVGQASVFFPDLDKRPGWKRAEDTGKENTNGIDVVYARYINENVRSFGRKE